MEVELKNNTLDDIAAAIGMTATLRLSAWFGDGAPVYVPAVAEDGQTIVKLIGMPAAKALSKMWGLEHLAVPRISNYEVDLARRRAGRLHEMGFGANEIGQHLRLSKRRVLQLLDELRQANLLPEIAQKNARKNPGQNRREKEAAEKAPRALPPEFFGKTDVIRPA